MKYSLLNWKTHLVVALLAVVGSGCVKSKGEDFPDLSKSEGFVILPNSGLANFWGEAWLYISPYSPDTFSININVGLARVQPLKEDVTVTISVDDAKRIQFNNDNPWAGYLAFTNDMYTLKDTKIVIKAGATYGSTVLEFYTPTIDFYQTWMLPITISDASGKPLTANLNTMYYHIN